MTDENIRQKTLRDIATMLREFDFENYDPYKNKVVLMDELKKINSMLGKLLRGYP